MGPFEFMVEGLSAVVEQARAFRKLHVESELAGHQTREMGNFDGMHENVLAVRRPVFQTAEELDQFGVESVDARLERRLFAGVLDDLVDFLDGGCEE